MGGNTKDVVDTVVAPTRFMILSNLGIVKTTAIIERPISVLVMLLPSESLRPAENIMMFYFSVTVL